MADTLDRFLEKAEANLNSNCAAVIQLTVEYQLRIVRALTEAKHLFENEHTLMDRSLWLDKWNAVFQGEEKGEG